MAEDALKREHVAAGHQVVDGAGVKFGVGIDIIRPEGRNPYLWRGRWDSNPRLPD
jgi:hypothetical protein